MKNLESITRRNFLKTTGTALGGSILATGTALSNPVKSKRNNRMRVALVGTGARGPRMFYTRLIEWGLGDYIDMAGICDRNAGRVAYAKEFMNYEGPTFTDLEKMLQETSPDWLIITTWDWEHHNNIITGMKHGCNIICEKPLTIDEEKAEMILAAEKKYGKEVIVTFNYRWVPGRAKVKELLMNGAIGDITTVDLHWNLSHGHLQRYMQRWHGESDRGGTLWVHKATHHFDLVNWWLDSDPEEIHAYADLERFGPKGPFRGANCRNCAYTKECPYYWNITEHDRWNNFYAKNEHYDGYIRDNCVFREQIDIFDKHSAMVKYANNVYLNYSLTADSDNSGFWLAFNGTKGRIEGREGGLTPREHTEWKLQPLGKEPETIRVYRQPGTHQGGDPLILEKLFKDPDMPDPLQQAAGTRDGVMSILPGIAARKSVETGKPVKIEDLTSIKPQAKRPRV